MKNNIKTICTHQNTIQIGTEITVEVYCVDCCEVVRVGKTIKKKL